MKTNFFTEIEKHIAPGNSVIIDIKNVFGKLTVSVANHISTSKDESKKITPVLLTGNCNEMDEGFFEAIKPVQETIKGLIVKLEEANTQLGAIEEESKKKVEKKAGKKTEKKDDPDHNENDPDLDSLPAELKEKPAKVKKPSLSELTKKANELMQGLKHTEALEILKQALTLKPDNASVKQSIETCEKWIRRKQEADMFEATPQTSEPKKAEAPKIDLSKHEEPLEPLFNNQSEEQASEQQPTQEEDNFDLF